MEKLNVRFNDSTKDIIDNLSKDFNSTFSDIARTAMNTGLGIMKVNNDLTIEQIKNEEFKA